MIIREPVIARPVQPPRSTLPSGEGALPQGPIVQALMQRALEREQNRPIHPIPVMPNPHPEQVPHIVPEQIPHIVRALAQTRVDPLTRHADRLAIRDARQQSNIERRLAQRTAPRVTGMKEPYGPAF